MAPEKRPVIRILIGWLIPLAALSVGLRLVSAHQSTASRTKEQPAIISAPDLTQEIELIGHIGGNASAIDVNEKYIAAAYKGGFELISIIDPAHPRDVGFLTFPFFIQDVALNGDYAYITYYWSDGFGHDLGGLYIIDISDPTAPELVGDYRTDVVYQNVAVSDQYAYVTRGFNTAGIGLSVLDVSNPSAPLEVGQLSGVYLDYGFELLQEKSPGDHLYAYAASQNELYIIDLTDPTQPEVIGNHKPWSTNIVDVVVNSQYYDQSGDIYLYLTEYAFSSSETGGIEIVDATDPTSPVPLTTYDPSTNYGYIRINAGYAYATSDQGLHILDISDPTAPQEVATYTPTANIFDLAVRGKYIYIADFAKGLHILDVSEPSNPVAIAYQGDVIGYVALIAGHYAYAFDINGDQGMQVWDVMNPVAPIQVGSLPMPSCCTAVAKSGGYALLADDEYILRVFDISDLSQPIEISTINFGLFSAIAVKGEIASPDGSAYAYLTSWQGTCWFSWECDGYVDIFDLSDPSTPSYTGTYFMQGIPVAISIFDPYAFIAVHEPYSGTSYLASLDITDVQPSLITTVTVNSRVWDMSILDAYAYLALSDGLSVIDISNPASPVEIGRYEYTINLPQGGYLSSIVAKKGFAYLSDFSNSLLVAVDISDPTHPQEVARLQMPGDGIDLAISGDVIYASNDVGGLSIYQHAPGTGRVRDVNSRPFSGVTVALDDQAAAASGLTGSYDLSETPAGTHTLSPELQGFAFWPPDRTLELTADTSGQDFTILPHPISITLSASLTTTLRYTDTSGLLTQLDFPPVPLPGNLTLVLTPTLSAGFAEMTPTGHAFDMLLYQDGSPLTGFSFPSPVLATIHYSRLNVKYIADESQLGLYWWNGSTWMDSTDACGPLTSTYIDLEERRVEVDVCQTGSYTLFGPTNHKYLPLINR